MHWYDNNLFGWVMSRNLLVDGFKWRKDKFIFDEEFMQNYDKDSDKRYILKLDVKKSIG